MLIIKNDVPAVSNEEVAEAKEILKKKFPKKHNGYSENLLDLLQDEQLQKFIKNDICDDEGLFKENLLNFIQDHKINLSKIKTGFDHITSVFKVALEEILHDRDPEKGSLV